MAASVLLLQSPTSPHASPHGFQRIDDIEFFVTTPRPNNSPFDVMCCDTISSVTSRIQACRGSPQSLVFGGRELSRQNSHISLTNDKVFQLVLKFSELQVVTIRTIIGKEHVLTIHKKKCVRDLKQRISLKEGGLTLQEQQLVLRGEELGDDRRIGDLSLEDDAVVHLFIRSTESIRANCVHFLTDSECVSKKDHQWSSAGGDEHHFADQASTLSVAGAHFRKGADSIQNHLSGLSAYNISPVLIDLIQRVRAGLEHGHSPVLSSEGSGGVYFMKDEYGKDFIGVFKPMDEEPLAVNNPRGFMVSLNGEGLKKGTRVGEGAFREVAAYILDHPATGHSSELGWGFAGVPPTVMVDCFYKALMEEKIGSLQMFVHAFSNCEDMGPARFPVHEVHKIAVLDMRLANTDRNGGNLLVCKQGDDKGQALGFSLVPIDHGYCLPEKFEDCTFEWLYWPQAKVPFQPPTVQYIAALDAEMDILLLQHHGWNLPVECARVLRVGTLLLKKGATAGLTPFEIGSMMCREALNKKSLIEEILEAAEGIVVPKSSETIFLEAVSGIMDMYIQAVKAKKLQAQKVDVCNIG